MCKQEITAAALLGVDPLTEIPETNQYGAYSVRIQDPNCGGPFDVRFGTDSDVAQAVTAYRERGFRILRLHF